MRTLLAFGLAFAATVSAAAADELSCPATVDTDDTAGGLSVSHKLRHVSFYDGDPAEMADLAPDDASHGTTLEQRWQLTRSEGRPIVMVCRYHDTEQTVRKEVPADITACRLDGLIDSQGQIVGSPKLTCN